MREYNFKAYETRDKVIEWIKRRSETDNFSKAVLGISGGKDSTVAAALCCRALGSENVHGLLLPNGIQPDIDDSIEVCKKLGISYDTINIKPIYDAFLLQYVMYTTKEKEFRFCNNLEDAEKLLDSFITGHTDNIMAMPSSEAVINIAPRIRMTMLRLWGQSNHHRLCGTSNFSEITVGYCTKDGDTSCDFSPLGRLTSLEVVEIGKTMEEIPEHLVTKTPTDGLSGKSDEEKLGVSYTDIHKYIRGINIPRDIWDKIHKMDYNGLHKRTNTTVFDPEYKLLYS